MDVEDIERILPNGFHDALLQGVHLDYLRREAIFDLDVWVGDLSSRNEGAREAYRKASLRIVRFIYCVIEPPDPNCMYYESNSLIIDGGSLRSLKEPLSTLLPEELPQGAFCYWFFIRDWNSFIFVSGMDAQLDWIETAK